MDEGQLYQGKEDFVKTFYEGMEVLMVRKGSNKAGRFLEAAVFAEGGQKVVIWLPEGRGGWGWRRFVGKLLHLLALTVAKDQSPVSRVISSGGGFSSTRSYAAMLSASPGALNPLSVNHLDLVPMTGCSELVNGHKYGTLPQKEKAGSVLGRRSSQG